MGIGSCWLGLLTTVARLALVAVYMDDSIGFAGANVARFGQIVEFGRTHRRLLVAYGDWNMSPQQLNDGAGLEELGLTIVAPTNASQTCLVGRGTLSTFFVVSVELGELIRSCEAFEGTWGTHMGVRCTMSVDVANVNYTAWRKPRRFLRYDVPADENLWQEARDEHFEEHGHTIPGKRVDGISYFDLKERALGVQEELGTKYAAWAGTLELLLMRHNGIAPERQRAFAGRASFPRLVARNLSQHPAMTTTTDLNVSEELGLLRTKITRAVVLTRTRPIANFTTEAAAAANRFDSDRLMAPLRGALKGVGERFNKATEDLGIGARVDETWSRAAAAYLGVAKAAMSALTRSLAKEAREHFRDFLEQAMLAGARKAHAVVRSMSGETASHPPLLLNGQPAASIMEVVNAKASKAEAAWSVSGTAAAGPGWRAIAKLVTRSGGHIGSPSTSKISRGPSTGLRPGVVWAPTSSRWTCSSLRRSRRYGSYMTSSSRHSSG